jgi:tetratricopeptide (TPR) repeat protein
MHRDCRNLFVTASSVDSIAMLDDAVNSYLGMRKDVGDRATALVAADPECPLGHCLVGYLNLHAGKRETLALARAALEHARSCASTPREGLHVGALDSWLNGNFVRALDHWEQILATEPRDVLALRLAQFITSYLGRTRALLETVARVLPAWEASVPGYGFVLGCYAYGLEECGEYEQAERAGRAAVDLNREDLWATHAVAHVMEMKCRAREGVTWVESQRTHLAACGNFVRHLWWHHALFLLVVGDYDGVLQVYDRQVRAESTDEYLDIANSASLLWRLEQAGVEVGGRWRELATRAEDRMHDHVYVLADLHYMFALAAGSATRAVESFLQSCEDFSLDTRTEAKVMQSVGLGTARAIVHHRNNRFAEALDAALPVSKGFHAIGGSHAQRDIFDQLLIDAAIRAERLSLAQELLRERTSRRPGDLWAWKHLARVSSLLTDESTRAAAETNIHALQTCNALPNNAVPSGGKSA